MNDRQSAADTAMQLHHEFPIECAFFVEFTEAVGNAILSNLEYNRETWSKNRMPWSFDLWLGFITEIISRIKKDKAVLKHNAGIFGRLLFGDVNRMFTLHCLYVLQQAVPENEQFNDFIRKSFFPA